MDLLFLAEISQEPQQMMGFIGVVGLALTGLSLIGGFLQFQQGRAAAKAADAQAEAEAEARRQEAKEEQSENLKKAAAEARQRRLRLGAIENLFARSGIALEGTAATLLTEQARADRESLAEANRASSIDFNRRFFNAAMIRSRGKTQSNILKSQANLGLAQSLIGTASASGAFPTGRRRQTGGLFQF